MDPAGAGGRARPWAKKLVQFNRVTSLEREQARLEGERDSSSHQSRRPRAKSRNQNPVLQIDQDMRTEVSKDLPKFARRRRAIEKRVAAEDELKRIDIRAPQNGMVHQLDVHTSAASCRRGNRSC